MGQGGGDKDRRGKQQEGKGEVGEVVVDGMGMQGVQEVVSENCEYQRAPEGCARGAGMEQEDL